MSIPNNPLTEDHYTLIKKGIAAADEAQRQIDLAKAAGLPVDQHEKDARESRARLQRIKDVYFPGR